MWSSLILEYCLILKLPGYKPFRTHKKSRTYVGRPSIIQKSYNWSQSAHQKNYAIHKFSDTQKFFSFSFVKVYVNRYLFILLNSWEAHPEHTCILWNWKWLHGHSSKLCFASLLNLAQINSTQSAKFSESVNYLYLKLWQVLTALPRDLNIINSSSRGVCTKSRCPQFEPVLKRVRFSRYVF